MYCRLREFGHGVDLFQPDSGVNGNGIRGIGPSEGGELRDDEDQARHAPQEGRSERLPYSSGNTLCQDHKGQNTTQAAQTTQTVFSTRLSQRFPGLSRNF